MHFVQPINVKIILSIHANLGGAMSNEQRIGLSATRISARIG